MDLYRENILDHYKNPRNFGVLPGYTHAGESANASCGDKIRIEVKVSDDRIADIRFSGTGCAVSMASASMLTEAVKGKKINAARVFSQAGLEKLLGTSLTPARVRCATLPLEVLRQALSVL